MFFNFQYTIQYTLYIENFVDLLKKQIRVIPLPCKLKLFLIYKIAGMLEIIF